MSAEIIVPQRKPQHAEEPNNHVNYVALTICHSLPCPLYLESYCLYLRRLTPTDLEENYKDVICYESIELVTLYNKVH